MTNDLANQEYRDQMISRSEWNEEQGYDDLSDDDRIQAIIDAEYMEENPQFETEEAVVLEWDWEEWVNVPF